MVNGLQTLQHRGQESAGISYIDEDNNNKFTIDKKLGLVNIFTTIPTVIQENY